MGYFYNGNNRRWTLRLPKRVGRGKVSAWLVSRGFKFVCTDFGDNLVWSMKQVGYLQSHLELKRKHGAHPLTPRERKQWNELLAKKEAPAPAQVETPTTYIGTSADISTAPVQDIDPAVDRAVECFERNWDDPATRKAMKLNLDLPKNATKAKTRVAYMRAEFRP